MLLEHPFDRITRYVYFFVFFVIIIISVVLMIDCDKPSQIERADRFTLDFSTQWSDESGNPIERADRLNLVETASMTDETSIYAVIPEDIPEGLSLCFRAKHIYFSVCIDGENVYTQDLPENKLYTNSDGAVWAFIPISVKDAGKKIEFRYKLCYPKSSSCGIDYLEITSERKMLLSIINEKFFGFLMSVIYITFGAVLVVLDVPITIKLNKNHSFLYLGFITITVAMYSIVETQVFQLFIGDERIMHILSCFSLLLIPIPMVLYTNSMFPFKHKESILVFGGIHFMMFTVLGILNYFDIADYHDTMTAIHLFLIIAVVTMFVKIIGYIINHIKAKKKNDIYIVFEVIGLAITLVTGTIDILRFYLSYTTDPARYVRIGLLGFVICFSISSCERLLTALTLSTKAQLISNLAYHDGLTGLFNRTAYNEKLEELLNTETCIGICAFDVNNLKKINDNLGHDMGDKLIKASGKIISSAVEKNGGICYRIGGDEFMAIICGEDMKKRIDDSMIALEMLCREFNEKEEYPFKISIANGSSIYNSGDNMENVIKNADKLMYEKKRLMKKMLST